MKRMVLMLLCLVSIVCNAQVWLFRSTAFAMADVSPSGKYTWDDWEDSNLLIRIDTDEKQLSIFSKRTQVYSIYAVYNNGNYYPDGMGGKVAKFYVTDQDGDNGEVRLRSDADGILQIYIDFNNISWCYRVVKIQ